MRRAKSKQKRNIVSSLPGSRRKEGGLRYRNCVSEKVETKTTSVLL